MQKIFIPVSGLLIIILFLFNFCKKPGNEKDAGPVPAAAALTEKITNLQRDSDTAGIHEYMHELKLLLSVLPDSETKGKACYISGNYYTFNKEYDQASKWYNEAYSLANRLDSLKGKQLRAYALFNNSLMYYENGDYESVLSMCLEAENIFDRLNDNYGLALVCNRMGGVYLQLNNNEKATFYNGKAWEKSVLADDIYLRVQVMNGYGNFLLHTYTDSSEKALNVYQQARGLAEETGNKKVVSDSWYNQAHYHSRKGDYPRALEYYHNAYKWALMSGNQYDICDALYKIGLTWYYLENYEISRDTLFSALEMAERTGSKLLQRNTCDVLGFLEEATGNYKEATYYLNRNLDLVYEIFSEEERQQVNFLESRYMSQKRENEIIVQKSRIHRQKMVITGGVIFMLIFSALAILIIITARHKQVIARQKSELQQQIISELEKDRELIATKSVLKGEETERSRIARDLHDGLGGMLSV